MSEHKDIFQSLAAVMADVSAIGKNRKNQQQGFRFRGIDDVYNAVHPLLAKHGVFTTPEVLSERTEERTTGKGGNLIYRVLTIRYTFFAADGSYFCATVIGEAMDSGDKAANKAMAVAHKYALLQTLCIPTEDMADPDAETQPTSTPAAPPRKDASADERRALVGEIVEIFKAEAFTDEERKNLKTTLAGIKTNPELKKYRDSLQARVDAAEAPQDIF